MNVSLLLCNLEYYSVQFEVEFILLKKNYFQKYFASYILYCLMLSCSALFILDLNVNLGISRFHIL